MHNSGVDLGSNSSPQGLQLSTLNPTDGGAVAGNAENGITEEQAAPPAGNGESTAARGNGEQPAPPNFNWYEYDRKLKSVKRIAVGTNIFYALNWFLGFCALTWATTVILGGMVTSIRQRDYYSVAVLLILEALRLATARFFGFFITKHLIHCSADPTKLVYHDVKELVAKELLRTLSQVLELSVLSISIVLPSRRLRDVHYNLEDSCQNYGSSACNFNAVESSLKIFYIIVLVNAGIAAIGVLYSKTIMYVHFNEASYAMRRYYHSIVWNGIMKGLLQSTDLDIMKFAFQIQAEEYKNNKRAAVVKETYKDLMMYLYEHPKHKGFEAAKVALDSEDTFVREAAANLVGLWIDLGIGGGNTLIMQETLLSKLADALEHEETGRSATSTFEQLAKSKYYRETAEVRNSRNKSLVDILMKRIHQAVQQRKPDKAIVFVKVFITLLEKLRNDIIQYSDESSAGFDTLRNDLISIAQFGKLKRTKVVAAYALVRMSEMVKKLSDDEYNKVRKSLLSRSGNGNGNGNGGANRTPANQSQGRSPAAKCSTELHRRAIQLLKEFCGWIWTNTVLLLWNLILDCLVGKDPENPGPKKKHKPEHILKNEADYLKTIVQEIHRWETKDDPPNFESELRLQENGLLLDCWKPEEIQVRDVGQPPQYNQPIWLVNIKMTTYIAAIVMVILVLGVSAILIFYPHIHGI